MEILTKTHESSFESAHEGAAKFYLRMRELYFWPLMSADCDMFVKTCDVCQKVKVDRTKPMGGLRPAHIPRRPFSTISLDLIMGLSATALGRR